LKQRDLEAIAEQCRFVTIKVDEMEPEYKRNLLFHWYATNLLNIVGRKKNLGKMPVCLVHAIRSAYPDPNGVYSGDEEAV
jgi:hypothetical protein